MVRKLSSESGKSIAETRKAIKGLSVDQLKGDFKGLDNNGKVLYGPPDKKASEIFDKEFGLSPAFDWQSFFQEVQTP